MLHAALQAVHMLAVVLWVGGMAFVLLVLRPALATLEPPARLQLMREVLRRFFDAVTLAVLLILGSGFGMIGRAAPALSTAASRGGAWPIDWILMVVLGLVMVVIFGFIRIVLFARFEAALDRGELPPAAGDLARIRTWVTVNLALGVTVIVVAVMV